MPPVAARQAAAAAWRRKAEAEAEAEAEGKPGYSRRPQPRSLERDSPLELAPARHCALEPCPFLHPTFRKGCQRRRRRLAIAALQKLSAAQSKQQSSQRG